VGESTRRATESAIAYEPAGEHEVKGKSDPLLLFRALRVTAARGGAQKSVGLEPPFVGRDRELRLVKELAHACAEEGKAQLVSVVGIAGTGRSWRTGRSPRWFACVRGSWRTSRPSRRSQSCTPQSSATWGTPTSGRGS